MKKMIAILLFTVVGTNISVASSTIQSLDESFLGQPFDIFIGKGKVKIDTCRDMLKARENNKKIRDVLADVDDNTWVGLMDEMTSCELSSELLSIGAKKIDTPPLSFEQFVKYFPENLLPSPGPDSKQVEKLASIYEKYPDTEVMGDTATTVTGDFTMSLLWQKKYKTKSGREFTVASISLGLNGGTWSSIQDYIIIKAGNKLWNVKTFDYNSKLTNYF